MDTTSLGLGDMSSESWATGNSDEVLCRPTQCKLSFHYPCSMVEHFNKVCTLYSRVPFLPKLRSGDDSFPRLHGSSVVYDGHVEGGSINVFTRLGRLSVHEHVSEVRV